MASNSVADRLLSYVMRLERLDEERRALAADMADIRKEAKSAGFDPKVINQMMKERRMSASEREEWQALCETYRAALGMLDGTPLGENARKRFQEDERPTTKKAEPSSSTYDEETGEITIEPDESPSEVTEQDLITAQAEGAAAAKAGKRVSANPYAASDRRRAKWDEGYCAASGSDGMDIPSAWRRSSKKTGADEQPKGDA